MRTRIALISAILLAFLSAQPVLASDLALIGAKVYLSPSDPPLENATIIVHNGRITAVGPSATTKPPRFARAVTVIHCERMVVTAGFWNSHVHIFTSGLLHSEKLSSSELSAQLEAMLTRWGFTTAQDVTVFSKVAFTIRHGKILCGKP
jgi:cytosine/adenosine deaminase-related metal-dependent hydrolase